MSFKPPVDEQRFVLTHVAGIDELSSHKHFAAASSDLVDAIVHGAAHFAAAEFAPLNRVGDRTGATWSPVGVTMPPGFREAYQSYVANGWATLAAPLEYGGQGLPLSLATVLLEDLGAANMAFSLCMMLTAGAVDAIERHGTDEIKRVWLPKLVTGEWTGTMNLTEPQAGSDLGALKTRAEPTGEGTYRIKGQKIFITYGEHDLAENIVHLVLARLPGAPAGSKGISLFLVPKFRLNLDGSCGVRNDVSCVSIEHKLGIHASPTCVMSFGDRDDCIGWLIGQENCGMHAMFTMMNRARLNVGLEGVSIAEAATQQAAAHARQRIQGSRGSSSSREPVAIIEHPDVRRMLMRMTSLTQGARALTYYAAGQADRAALGESGAQARLDLLTPIVKACATAVGVEVASLGIQVHGGMGYVEETGAAQHFRDVRIAPIYEGTNGIQAADLVIRKISLKGGAVLQNLLDEIRSEIGIHNHLMDLLNCCERASNRLIAASVVDRLAASSPYLAMLSTVVTGWLMARQLAAVRIAQADDGFLAMKKAAAQFYLAQIVPEARGLEVSCLASADLLYSVPEASFAA